MVHGSPTIVVRLPDVCPCSAMHELLAERQSARDMDKANLVPHWLL